MVNKKDRLEIELVIRDLFSKTLKRLDQQIKGLTSVLNSFKDNFKSAATDLRAFNRVMNSTAAGMGKLKAAQAALSAQVRGTTQSFGSLRNNLKVANNELRSFSRATSKLGKAFVNLEALSKRLASQEVNLSQLLKAQAAQYQRLAAAAREAAIAKERSAAAGKPITRGAGRNIWTGARELTADEEKALQTNLQFKALSSPQTTKGIKKAVDTVKKLRSELSGLPIQQLRQFGVNAQFAAAKSTVFSKGIQTNIARLRALRTPVTATSEALAKVQLRWKAMIAGMKAGDQEMNRISFTFRRLFGILAAFAAARYAVAGFFGLIKSSIAFNANIEQARIGIATLFMATSEMTDQTGKLVEESQRFPLALQEAQRQMQQLRLDALKSTATFQQLVETYQVAIAPGIQAGLNPDQIRKFSLRIAQAAAAIGLPMNQLAEEIRSTLAGTIQLRTTRIAAALGITNEDIRNAKEAGKLYEFLNKKFQAFAQTQDIAAGTLHGLIQRLKDFGQVVAGEAGESFFKRLKGYLADIIKSGLQMRGGLIRPSQKAVQAFKLIFEQLELILKDLHDLAQGDFLAGMARIITMLLQAGRLIGHYFVGGFIVVVNSLNIIAKLLKVITSVAQLVGIEAKNIFQILGLIVIGQKLAVFTALRLKKVWGALAITAKEIKTAFIALRGLTFTSLVSSTKALASGFKSIIISAMGVMALTYGINEATQSLIGTSFSVAYQLTYAWKLLKATIEAVTNRILFSIATMAKKSAELLYPLHLISTKTLTKITAAWEIQRKKMLDTMDISKNAARAMDEYDRAADAAKNKIEKMAKQEGEFHRRQQAVLTSQQLLNNELEITKNHLEATLNLLRSETESSALPRSVKLQRELNLQLIKQREERTALIKQGRKELDDLRAKGALDTEVEQTRLKWRAKLADMDAKHELANAKLQFQKEQAQLREQESSIKIREEYKLSLLSHKEMAAQMNFEQGKISEIELLEAKRNLLTAEREVKLKAVAAYYEAEEKFAREHGATAETLNEIALKRLATEQKINDEYDKQDEKIKRVAEVYEGGIPAAAENGLKLFADKYKDEIKMISDLMQDMTEKLANFISDAIVDAFDPTKDKPIKERFGEFLQDLARMIMRFAIKMAIAKAISSALGGGVGVNLNVGGGGVSKWRGGLIDGVSKSRARPTLAHLGASGFAQGGRPAGIHPSDTIPIWVAPGEYIVRREAVRQYGVQALEAINRGLLNPVALRSMLGNTSRILRTPQGPGYAEGGVVATVADSKEPAKTEKEATITPAIIVANDEALDRLLTGGKGAFLRFLNKHSAKIREALK